MISLLHIILFQRFFTRLLQLMRRFKNKLKYNRCKTFNILIIKNQPTSSAKKKNNNINHSLLSGEIIQHHELNESDNTMEFSDKVL